jgi:hypothetical protein
MATRARAARKTAVKLSRTGAKLHFIEPMECAPVATLPEGPEWTYEIKLHRLAAGVWTLPLSQENTSLEA